MNGSLDYAQRGMKRSQDDGAIVRIDVSVDCGPGAHPTRGVGLRPSWFQDREAQRISCKGPSLGNRSGERSMALRIDLKSSGLL